MLKAAHFIDSHDPGGAETVIVDICRRIGVCGYAPEVYHFGNAWLEGKCREYGIPSFFVPGHRWYRSARTLPLFIPIFIRFLKSRRIDVLHSHLFAPVTSASFAAFFAGIPHLGTFHDIYTFDEKKKRIRYARLASLLGTRLVTVSHQMNSHLTSLGKFAQGDLLTIVNGVDLNRFNVPADRRMYPELGLDPADVVLICVGRLEKVKGHDILIKALGKIGPKKHMKLLLVGEGPCRRELELQIKQEKLLNNVILPGQRDDVPALLSLSDCFVLSSRSEGLSCSVIEAMAAGLPVIATDVGGNSELVAQGINGYLVPPENAELLSSRMRSLIDDAARREQFGKMSRQRARGQYSLDAMVGKYADIYNALIHKGRRLAPAGLGKEMQNETFLQGDK